MRLGELAEYLNDFLGVASFTEKYNGLQVEGKPELRRVALAVDGCLATIEAAAAGNADAMVVHHGLFWGDTAPVTGMYHARLARLIEHDMSLFQFHLPLDAHQEVGNNHVLARMLGMTVGGTFDEYDGVGIGVWGDKAIARVELVSQVSAMLGIVPRVIPTGPERVARLGILSGGGGGRIAEAKATGCDTLLTGEGAHYTYFDGEELGVNVIHAGHYATETVGIRALGEHLSGRLGLETFFIDHPTGM